MKEDEIILRDELEKLKNLYNDGLISKEVYDSRQSDLLNTNQPNYSNSAFSHRQEPDHYQYDVPKANIMVTNNKLKRAGSSSSKGKTMSNIAKYSCVNWMFYILAWIVMLCGIAVLVGVAVFIVIPAVFDGTELEFFVIGEDKPGVIAIGGNARGIIAIGQFAVGFIAIGQFTVGFLTIGMFGVGIVGGLGMGIAGLGVSIAMFTFSAVPGACMFGFAIVECKVAMAGINVLAPLFKRSFTSSCGNATGTVTTRTYHR